MPCCPTTLCAASKMATRHPLSWLVIDTATDRNGVETALLARAVYDSEGDMLIVTDPGGQRDVAHVGGHPMQPLAKHMLRQLFKREQDAAC